MSYLNRNNFRTFHRRLYGPLLETVRCLKRNDDMEASVVRSVTLFECRWSVMDKHGQPIAGDMLTEHFRTIHIPNIQMERNQIAYFNPLDRFVDAQGWYWQPESGQTITSKLLLQHCCVDCRRVDAVSPWIGRNYQ